MQIDTSKPVLVTGATGYVAGMLVKKLLENGIHVHAAVRDPENNEKLKYLNETAEKAPGQISYFKADLLQDGSYDDAMKDCELVFHTASPFTLNVDDPQRDLVDPAVEGTRNVLESANRTESVKRVVVTSSCVAIIGDNKDIVDYPNGTATEEHWNETSSVDHNPYPHSKVAAEKAAWEIASKQNRWQLVTVNPSLVVGPGLNPHATSESFNIIKQLSDGTMAQGVPEFSIAAVDVRDVADVHYEAGFNPDAEGRYISSAKRFGLLEMSELLRKEFGEKYPFPKKKVPKLLLWLIAPKAGFSRKWVWRNIGYPFSVDNAKSREKLGIEYRPVEDAVKAMFIQMRDNGLIPEPENK